MSDNLSVLMEGYPVWITQPVQWGDQDAFGHVNNTIYLRWFESARIVYGERMGLSDLMETQRIGPILAAISCSYRRQLTYPDTVRIGARISRIGRTSMVMEHRVVSEKLQSVVAEGDSTIVTFNYGENKSIPVPAELRAKINEIEGHPV
jgi:acyl-CoA thioester hydrolase